MGKIIIKNLSKRFNKSGPSRNALLALFLSFISAKKTQKDFSAFRDISLEIGPGEIVGLVGRNGSGKSTLLRTIAGIYATDSGKIIAKGKIVPLINLDSSFQYKLSMRDNIYLYCTLLGLEKKDIDKRFESIVAFSELADHVDSNINQFSNGMLQRLAFSIAIHCNPDILLLDEVFESTDKNFQKKCEKAIKNLSKKGVTILLVSHDSQKIRKNCTRFFNIRSA